jgi:probable H4MPT-linked C1 transfer pathway protein
MVAASNWHALATWSAARFDLPHDRLQLVLDIGSTTTDIVPLREGKVASLALTDRQRMECGQLVYTGIGRTAVAAILQQVEFESGWCPLVAETFATSDDAYLVLRLSPEVPSDQATADGRPRTIRCAGARLARMIGEDLDRLAWRDIERLAEAVIDRQAVQIAEAITRNFDDLNELPASPRILVSGHGRALAQRVLPRLPFPVNSIWLDTLVSPSAARCAPAHAVAWLLSNYLKSE